jgi:indole-3-glycerol phosphate synthase
LSDTILDKIIAAKKIRIDAARALVDDATVRSVAKAYRNGREAFRLRKALSDSTRTNIIAEFKRASPSKGIINDELDPANTAMSYRDRGAAAISVLTEEDFFRGSLDDLRAVRAAVDIPVLRKDFTVDEYQIFEAAAAGADAILLIVAAMDASELSRLRSVAHGLGLDVLVEVHDADELEIAHKIGADLIGVNNRNLKTFEVSIDVSRRLIGDKRDALFVSESGLSATEELDELSALGYDGFLIGETFMRGGLDLFGDRK